MGKFLGSRWRVALVIWLCVTHVATQSDEDFGFEVTGDEDLIVEVTPGGVVPSLHRVHEIPDLTIAAGRYFQYTIPQDTFSATIKQYEVKSTNSKIFPSWLLVDRTKGSLRGVPVNRDVGEVHLTIVAHSAENIDETATDEFTIRIVSSKSKSDEMAHETRCTKHDGETVLSIIFDAHAVDIKPKQRLIVIENLARFLGQPISAFALTGQTSTLIGQGSIILAGPGERKHLAQHQQSAIEIVVGCHREISKKFVSLISQLKEQARDGTISEVVGLPVVGWRVTVESEHERKRRDLPAGADHEPSYYDEDYEETDEESEGITEPPSVVKSSSTTTTTTSTPILPVEHPHRHHHGEPPVITEEAINAIIPIVESVDVTTTSSATPVTVKPTTSTTVTYIGEISPDSVESKTEKAVEAKKSENDLKKEDTSAVGEEDEYDDNDDDYEDDYDEDSVTEVPAPPSVTPATPQTQRTTEKIAITETIPTTTISTTLEEIEPTSSTSMSPPTTITPSASSPILTTSPVLSTTAIVSTTIEELSSSTSSSTTTIEEETTTTATVPRTANPPITVGVYRNSPPVIKHRLKKIAHTAGKVLSFIIPNDTFADPNGDALQISLLDASSAPIKKTSWIQFNPRTGEVYGLPLEEHVSKWDFVVQAQDREGATVSDILEINVQHHKGRRTVNHEFILKIRVEDKFDFPTPIDWEIRVLKGLTQLYRDEDFSQVTVRHVNLSSEPIAFIWTNDTLPRSHCPKAEIDSLLKMLVADDEGTPSIVLQESLSPEIRVKQVKYRGVGQCETTFTPPPPPVNKDRNFSPVLRNQIDHINAIVGELLVFTVPVDTFYDPEDGTTRHMKLTLLTMDRQSVAPDHWLQFDVKNQEFYGVPHHRDIGRREYQLVCEDVGGLTATDSLVVMVHSQHALMKQPSVEFSMNIDLPYESFVHSASMQRKFIEKLTELFHDRDASAIIIESINEGSTVVTWINRTLPIDVCPHAEISHLRRIVLNSDESVSDRVDSVMAPEFVIKSVSLRPSGVCQGEATVVHAPEAPSAPIDDSKTMRTGDDYLITYVVPGVLILIMLLLAGIVACVLYRRRRRSGKLNVGDEERRSLRAKGIPVIFQDELEEKPEPGNKTPIIMKEEKPPLLPPDYPKRGESPEEEALYQPPPPFPANRDTGRGQRPKATPTYRKPPPYVPP